MNKELFKNFRRGFTLIELLIVIAIIGVLAALLMANFVGVRERARDAQRKSDLRQIQSALELYRADKGTYPDAISCGNIFSDVTVTTTYMSKVPCDPLNTAPFVYTYTSVNSNSGYYIYTCLENINDSQKDTSNNSTSCSDPTTPSWSFTVQNP